MTDAYDLALTSYALAKAGSAKAAHAYTWMELIYKVEESKCFFGLPWLVDTYGAQWKDSEYSKCFFRLPWLVDT